MEKDELQQRLLPYFHWFHQHPELENAEFETTARIRQILDGIGAEILDSGLETGLVAKISGKADGPVVALRSDIDALPVTEETGLPYSSLNGGRMHACGHDFHLTALLGAAILLRERRDTLAGTVKLIFQPAEECGTGAKSVLAAGVLDDAQEIYGLHVAADKPTGVIAVSPGPVTATVGGFRITITGKGGHASAPHECADPIVAAAQLINAVQTIVSRTVSPADRAVVSITHVEAGNTWNVIPNNALLEGTIRAVGTARFEEIAGRLGDICEGAARTAGVKIDYAERHGASSVVNDPLLTAFAVETAKGLGLAVEAGDFGMGGEDFSLYQERMPGVFWTIGVGSPQAVHHPGFIADTAALRTAAELLAALGAGALGRLSGKAK
jgi:amidohydrolase